MAFREAHTLKGASREVGARAMSAAAQAVETGARQLGLDEARRQMPALEAAFAACQQAVAQLLRREEAQ